MDTKKAEKDILYPKAKRLARKIGDLTFFQLQDELKIGYMRTSRLMDTLKKEKLIKPKKIPAKATLDRIYKDKDWKKFKNKPVIPLGAETETNNLVGNLANGYNLIIAGETGSGKSSFFHSAMVNLLRNTKIDEIRFILIDPKQVEFSLYESLPNLVIPIIKTIDEAKKALRWCLKEIKEREKLMERQKTVVTIEDYNKKHKKKIPRIVVMIDECSDLMVADMKFFKRAVRNIIKSSYFYSVNIILATSRPSQEEVYPKKLVDLFSSRLAFKTATITDSQTILGLSGAEKLKGKGESLLLTSSEYEFYHLRGFYVSEKEVKKVVSSLKTH